MADMNLPAKGGRCKVHAPRIDLTPMVDLGFLLITFFMFTTTLAQNKVLPLTMPTKEPTKEPTVFREESTLTLIPASDHKLCYYEGAFKGKEALKKSDMSKVIAIVLDKKARVAALPPSLSAQAHKLHVLIKASDDSRYDDLVKAIDAMLITDVGAYMIVDLTADEQAALTSLQ